MASVDTQTRVEVSFRGGQTIGLLVPGGQADELERALADPSRRVFELEAEDGRYVVALAQVVFVKRHARESRIGFGGGS